MLHTVVVCCRNYEISSVALPCVCMCESVYVYAYMTAQLQRKRKGYRLIRTLLKKTLY